MVKMRTFLYFFFGHSSSAAGQAGRWPGCEEMRVFLYYYSASVAGQAGRYFSDASFRSCQVGQAAGRKSGCEENACFILSAILYWHNRLVSL
jgi:hypothetical protein